MKSNSTEKSGVVFVHTFRHPDYFIQSSRDFGRDIAIHPDGQIIVAAQIDDGHPHDENLRDTFSDFAVLRFTSFGALDQSFGINGVSATDIASYTPDFKQPQYPQSGDYVQSLAIQSDGKIIAAGNSWLEKTTTRGYDFSVIRYNADGSLDQSFGNNGVVVTDLGSEYDEVTNILVQADGKILVAGNVGYLTDDRKIALVRYNQNGTLDSTFSKDGVAIIDLSKYTWPQDANSGYKNDVIYDVGLQSDGKIVAIGTVKTGLAITRYLTDGSLDQSFGTDGIFTLTSNGPLPGKHQVSILANDKILIAGYKSDGTVVLMRLTKEGDLDPDFGIEGILDTDPFPDYETISLNISQLVVQPDEKFIVVGRVTIPNAGGQSLIIRYNSDGSLDSSFSQDGVFRINLGWADESFDGAIIQPDGKVVVTGYATTHPGTHSDYAITIVRLNNDGSLDSTFGQIYDINKPPIGEIYLNGNALQGAYLSINTLNLSDNDGMGEIQYKWLADGVEIGSTVTDYLKLTQAHVGKSISVVASYTDGFGTAERVVSMATKLVANVNDDPTGSVSISGTATQGQVLTASNTLADLDGLGEITYQWRSNGNNINGATGSSFTLTQAEVGNAITVVASYMDLFGTAESVVSGASQIVNATLSVTYATPVALIDSIGITPDGQYLLIKVAGVTQSVPVGSSLEFDGVVVTTTDLTSSITVQPVFQSSGGVGGYTLPEIFTGPSSLNLDYQLIESAENAVVIGSAMNDFIKLSNTNSVGKAVDGGGGDDVIDGGVGSTFISGGGGSNTFFLDGRASGVSWSTITDFAIGVDKATIWGWKQGISKVAGIDALGGADGYKGLTLHFENLLPSDASITDKNSNLNSITFSDKTLSDFGVSSVEALNAQIAAGDNQVFMTGQTVDDFGTHGYLYIA